eukprot:11215570-Lingulodinium_polyedra.AAC.1
MSVVPAVMMADMAAAEVVVGAPVSWVTATGLADLLKRPRVVVRPLFFCCFCCARAPQVVTARASIRSVANA